MCKTFFVFFLLFNFVIFVQHASAEVNTRLITSLDAELVLSGNMTVTGDVSEMKLKIYIPQSGYSDVRVSPDAWSYTEDELGNKMIMITWKNPSGFEKYEIKMAVKNRAKFFENTTPEEWFVDLAKGETKNTKVTEGMARFAAGDEGVWEKSVRFLKYVERNFIYDYDFLNNRSRSPNNAIEVWKSRKAVSGEFSNLLAALLRSQEIPARVVFGYAFPKLDTMEFEQDIGHGWAEVYVNGKWIPLDVTFFQAGYIDATHIKFANLLENNVTESLTIAGGGKADLKRNNLKVRILDYETYSPKVELKARDQISGGEPLLAEGTVDGFCMFQNMRLSSCVSDGNKSFFGIEEPSRKFWSCGRQNVYWIVKAPDINNNVKYTCPLTLQEIGGLSSEQKIEVNGNKKSENILISGPDQVKTGEEFVLQTGSEGTFFSPNLTENKISKEWKLSLNETGQHIFYFYSLGKSGKKTLQVIESKDLSFVKVGKPGKIFRDEWFLLNVTVKNIGNTLIPIKVRAIFQNQTALQTSALNYGEEKILNFNLTATESGNHRIIISEETTRTSYLTDIDAEVKKKPAGLLSNSFFDLVNKILEFIKNLFGI